MAIGTTAAMLGLAGAGALSGILGNRKSARTGTQASSTRRVLTPQQQRVMDLLEQQGTRLAEFPTADIQPLKAGAREGVNLNFAGLDEALRQRFLSHGGKSGKYGQAAIQGEVARMGKLGEVETDFAKLALAERDKGFSLLDRLLSMNMGQETEGEYMQPGSMLAGGFNSGIETLTTLLTLNRFLGGGGRGLGGFNT